MNEDESDTGSQSDERSGGQGAPVAAPEAKVSREPFVRRVLGHFQVKESLAFEVVEPGDLISDNRLAPGAPDLLEHEAIAKSVAEISLRADTPVNIALFGAWGSGKSSIYTMIESHLKTLGGGKVTVGRYDAWKYGGKELKRNFVDSLAEDLDISDPELREGMHRPIRTVQLDFSGWLKRNWNQLILAAVLATVGVLAFGLILAGATALVSEATFRQALGQMLPRTGAILGPIILAVFLAPTVLSGVSVTDENPAPEEGDQFAKRFKQLIKSARGDRKFPLVVFIDELDRCAPDEVVSTLRDLKTFLDEPGCVFIVAADREVIVRALRLEVAQARPVQGEEPYYATPGAYLDKIFQHQIALPPLRARALTTFAQTLADQQEGGVWGELRDSGDEAYQRVVFGLVPVHVRSPRRVKVLMNNFATNARVAQARGLDWLERADEIAVLTVLQTEFPDVVVSLRRLPKLLSYLRGEPAESDEARAIVAKHEYRDVDEPAHEKRSLGDDESENDEDGGSDEILNDKSSGSEESQAARSTLRRQLNSYLNKVAATPMRDPRPDLLYLRPAAKRELLPEPGLGDAIDFASDTAPAQTLAAFENQPSSVLAIAIPLIVLEGEQTQGLGRRFAYEAACRLVEQLEPQDYAGVTADAGAALTSALVHNQLTDDSKPGALLLASQAGSDEVERVLEAGLPGGVLKRIAALASHLRAEETTLVAAACAENFVEDPEALIALLDGAEVADAVDFWRAAESKVRKALNAAELPPAAEPEAAAATNPRQPAASAPPAPAKPEPTGEGVALMEQLLDAAGARSDGEALVSAVYASFQERPAASPFVQWTLAHRDDVISPMSDEQRRAEHAMRGIRAFAAGSWVGWAKLLPEATGPVSDRVAGIAADVLRRQVLPAFLDVPDGIELPALAALTASVSTWCELDPEEVAEVLRSMLEDADWEAEAAWEARQALYPLLPRICVCEDPTGPVPEAVLADIAKAPGKVAVDTAFVDACFDLVTKLPEAWQPPAVDELQEQDDVIKEDEAGPWLLLVLWLRKLVGQDPVAVDRLLSLSETTSPVVKAWMALTPELDEVIAVLGHAPVPVSDLGSYALGLDQDDRTKLWLAAQEASLSDSQVNAIGRHGLDAAAVSHIDDIVRQKTRQTERHAAVLRLTGGRPVAEPLGEEREVRRKAGALASFLLDQSGGDLRTAADLMIWAGGSMPKGDSTLREKFNGAVASAGKNALPRGWHPPSRTFCCSARRSHSRTSSSAREQRARRRRGSSATLVSAAATTGVAPPACVNHRVVIETGRRAAG